MRFSTITDLVEQMLLFGEADSVHEVEGRYLEAASHPEHWRISAPEAVPEGRVVTAAELKHPTDRWAVLEPDKPFPLCLLNCTGAIDKERAEFLLSLA